MGAFLSSEDVAKNDEVESTYLKQAEAVQDYVRKTPFEENNSTMRRELTAYTDKGISDLRGAYDRNKTMKDMYDDYTGQFTTLRGGYPNSMQQMINDYNSQFTTLQTTLTNNYTAADTALSTDYNNQFTTLRGEYEGNLSGLKSELEGDYNGKFNTLRGTYAGNLSGLQSDLKGDYEAQITALGTALRNEYTTGNTGLSTDYNSKFDTLRGQYDRNKNLKDLDDELRAYSQAQINSLRGEYSGTLTQLQSESNSQYATLNNLFTEFRDKTYATDRAAILKKAGEIEALINAESSGIKTKFDTDLAAFKAEYNQKLGDYALKSKVDDLDEAVTAGLTPPEILAIKTIINSKNFANLFADLKARGVITDVSTPTPAQFLRHLRRKNYVIY